jgi:hypothetical protein
LPTTYYSGVVSNQHFQRIYSSSILWNIESNIECNLQNNFHFLYYDDITFISYFETPPPAPSTSIFMKKKRKYVKTSFCVIDFKTSLYIERHCNTIFHFPPTQMERKKQSAVLFDTSSSHRIAIVVYSTVFRWEKRKFLLRNTFNIQHNLCWTQKKGKRNVKRK